MSGGRDGMASRPSPILDPSLAHPFPIGGSPSLDNTGVMDEKPEDGMKLLLRTSTAARGM